MSKAVVIVGSGLTGVSISHYLSEAKIPHIMVGDPPNDRPKLGESINPDGTTELINRFNDFSNCFYEKKLTIIGVGKRRIHCNFSAIGKLKLVKAVLNFVSPGLKVPEAMVHVDRANLDKNIFDSIKDNSYLTHYQEKVNDIIYNEATDEIEKVILESGKEIETSHVFDATNHLRLIGKATKNELTKLSELQQVTFCHYYNDNFDALEQRDWEHSTNLLKLTEEKDGVNGFAWCIPLESYVSVGVSISQAESAQKELKPEEIMEITRKAYLARGLDYKKVFPRANKAISICNQYFTHERAYGKNWLLAGPSYNQIWYMSGSGVACSLTAAYMAPKFISKPEKAGRAYQEYADKYIKTHHTIDWFVKTDANQMSEKKFLQMTYGWLMSNMKRMIRYPLLRGSLISSLTSRFVSRLLEHGFLTENYFSFPKYCPSGSITHYEDVWKPSSLTLREQREKNEQIIKKLFAVISHKHSIQEINKIMDRKVNLWMDNIPFWGRHFWKIWVLYLQDQKQISGLTLTAETFVHKANYINITARWTGKKNGKEEASHDVVGRCYIRNGKLVRIESKASNYRFILGENFKYIPVFLSKLPVIMSWYIKASVAHLFKGHSKKWR